jgi:hypothetical protein
MLVILGIGYKHALQNLGVLATFLVRLGGNILRLAQLRKIETTKEVEFSL